MLTSFITKFKANTEKAGRAQFTAGFIRGRRELLSTYWDKFTLNHQQLLSVEGHEDNEYFMNDRYSATELQYTATLGFLYDEEAKLSVLSINSTTTDARESRRVHLPKISLPTFSGHQEDWESFRDLFFRSLVHLDPGLSGVQKLQYLKTSVQGDAKRAIDSLTTTETNFTIAWQLLLKRYDNK